jgi:bleomycin hydrolase
MRKYWINLLGMLFLPGAVLFGQDSIHQIEGYQFTTVIDLPATPVKDQHRSGTCWSYSSLSFLESELIRMGKPAVDLSEMFVVWHSYNYKAEKYIRMHGNTNFGPGGAFHDATWVLRNFGMVPESAYKGLTIGEDKPVHNEMDEVLKSYLDGVLKNKNRKLSPVWDEGFRGLLNSYLGKLPEEFTYEGVKYNPLSFARDYLGLNPDDYIEIGSFTHHPFYEQFIIEIPDNWLWEPIYNVPLDEMMGIIDHALELGYTIAWGADVSDKGFASKDKGIAVVPDSDITEMSDSEISRWEKMDEKEREEALYKFDKPGKEKTITQVMRQIDFDNYTTTDDHGMHIVGTAKDQNGTVYYKVKNSWGEYNEYEGYFYASKAYVALRTIDIMIHKNALPKASAKALGIN